MISQTDSLISQFFRQSEGKWRSQRRYYTLPNGDAREMVSDVTVRFLEKGCSELKLLTKLHGFDEFESDYLMHCGAIVSWDTKDSSDRRQSRGSTVFGAGPTFLFRDRGFLTNQPVKATYWMDDGRLLRLRSEYNNSVFEEEIKLIGETYRTRQTIISSAGKQQMIGQYLETRLESVSQ